MNLFGNKDIPEFIEEKREQKAKKSPVAFREILDGSFLTRKWFSDQSGFIIFCTFLAIVYIANRHHAERIYRQTLKIQQEVKELRFEKITNASELMYLSRQSEVKKLVEKKGLDLEESQKPPKKLEVN